MISQKSTILIHLHDCIYLKYMFPASFLLQTFRYGTIDELKDTVRKFHKVGIKVLGDAVLNHRCAHFKNQNGVWNLFGGRLNWDDRAIVADDPHFQVLLSFL